MVVLLLTLAVPSASQRNASGPHRTPPPARPAQPARHASLPCVSPDGRSIVFCSDRDSTWELYVIAADGSRPTRLTHSAAEELVPGWMGDSRRVVFMTVEGDSTVLGAQPVAGGLSQTLVARVARGIALSHDGRRIAFTEGSWTRNRLWVSDLDGANAHALTDSAAGWFNIAWAPDDRRIAITHRDSLGELQVWCVDAGGGGNRALTAFDRTDGRPQWPAWSPDGRTIAIQAGSYDRQHPETNTSHIWLIDVASGRATRLAPHGEPRLDETPSWFPNGKHLAFQSDRTGRFEVWRMNADGTGQKQLTK
jgi:TolB protein